jgi:putative spermidine/putrescine transport system ATP-binding protein
MSLSFSGQFAARAGTSLPGASVLFRNVGKTYGDVAALADFSLSVGRGEFLTFLGPSGSGKTTALNILAGFVEPSSGDVLIDDVSITSLPSERRNIGMVFQSYSLFPHMDVRDNVGFPLRMRGVKRSECRRRAEAALEMVQLGGFGARKPHELSGGQRQRVAFARAVVFEPRVLLMDEPLGALDLKLREAMQDEIRQVQRRIGCTVIYVTHDQTEALAMSDRIVVMSNGGIEQIGTPSDIYDKPRNSFVARFIGETNLLPATVAGGVLTAAGGSITMPAPPGLANGWHGSLVLRPEHFRRGAQGTDSLSLACTIIDVTFQGGTLRYTAQAPGVPGLTIHERRGEAGGALAAGDQAIFWFRTASAVVLDS